MAAARRLIPLLDRVLVQRAQAQEKIGGVLLPDTAQKKLNEGVVVATGPGLRTNDGTLLPMGCQVGDKVLLPEYRGTEVSLGEESFVLFEDRDILGVLKDDAGSAPDASSK